MGWERLNEYVEMLKIPVLGSEDQIDGKRYMALCIDPDSKGPYRGIAREVTKREGTVDLKGFVDFSKLVLIESEDRLQWRVVNDLIIENIEEIVKKYEGAGTSFIGLEDPDIFVDEDGNKHVYFTIAYKKDKEGHKLFLGHAEGESLERLTATEPVIPNNKEVAISPIGNKGYRYILAESWEGSAEEGISLLKARSKNRDWEFKGLVFDPNKKNSPWCAGYASPCRLVNPSNMPLKENIMLGICTGNSGEYTKAGKEYRGDFEPGLFLFDYKEGNIPWMDDNSLFKDPLAKTITFASELVCLNDSEAILYAHPNDSFVRAYKLNLKKLKERIPKKFIS